ncbi:hypothetical protein [Brevibacillus gelatini]
MTTQGEKFYTIKDIESEAKSSSNSTFRGRANEAIEKIAEDFDIDLSKIEHLDPKWKTKVYKFNEMEKDLLVILLKNSKNRPLPHGNTQMVNVGVNKIYEYQGKLIKDIDELSEPLRGKITSDVRYQQAKDIQDSVKNIHQLVEKLEVLFYITPTAASVNFLIRVEKQLEEWTEELWKDNAIHLQTEALAWYRENGVNNPSKEQLEQYVVQQTNRKVELVTQGRDPEVHLLDHLIGRLLKQSIDERTK